MDEQTNSGRAFALYALVGIVFIGLLFAGIAFFKQRNSQMAANRSTPVQIAAVTPSPQDKAAQSKAVEQQKAAQDKAAQDKAATDKHAQQEAADKAAEQKKAADAKVAADKTAQDKAAQDKAAQDKANAAKPITAQPMPVAPTTGPGEVPATGSVTDYAMTSFATVLMGFGVVRWRQSKLQLQRSSFTRA